MSCLCGSAVGGRGDSSLASCRSSDQGRGTSFLPRAMWIFTPSFSGHTTSLESGLLFYMVNHLIDSPLEPAYEPDAPHPR